MYVIQVSENGKWSGGYVTPSGSEHSYTHNLAKARLFRSRQEAESYGLCGNEKIRHIEEIMQK